MKNIRNISYAVAAFLVTTATSCNKQLKEFNPSASTIDKQYTTPGGFVTLINMAYQDIHQLYGLEDGMFMCESGTDLWFNDSRGTYANQITQYVALASKQAQTTKHWTACYRGINYCNTGIELIDGAGFTNEGEKKSRLAELRFLRAFYYYHIVEQFGGVTLQLKSSLQGIETTKQRSTPEQFYDVMIDDLTFAKDNLPVKWTDAEYSRASKKSAAGMLAKVLLTRAYYATGGDRTTWFTKAKAAAEDVINNRTAYNVSLYPDYAQVGPSVYGAPGVRAANKEAMFVLAYSESNIQANAYTDGKNGNRIFKWMLPKYTTRPGMSSDFTYGVDNEQRLMPTWHLLDLFDESIDARYNASFQELWIANQAWTWGPSNWRNTDKLKYYKDSLPIQGQVIAKGDTAMFFTKKVWGGKATRRYLEIDRDELYQNPVHNQGAKIYNNSDSNNFVTSCYPAFKKFVNPNRTATSTTTDFGDALIMRFAEMFLIAAEAAVQLGDQTTATKWLNEIRERAALPGHNKTEMDITDPTTVDINYILDERGREFAGEQQRWYDLKRVFRTGTDWTAYILKYNPDLTSIQPYHRDRPVPLAELQALDNPQGYGQNKGYDQP